MTTEIKIKAWDKKRKLFIGNDILFCALFNPFNDALELKNGLQNPYKRTDKKNEMEMDLEFIQYTGLKDKNGKEIWEGDIVEIETKEKKILIDKVIYEQRFCGLRLAGLTDDYCDFTDWLKDGADFEVIGNIYQNPELLNGGKNE